MEPSVGSLKTGRRLEMMSFFVSPNEFFSEVVKEGLRQRKVETFPRADLTRAPRCSRHGFEVDSREVPGVIRAG